ncbi:MAG: glycosyltransferase family 2 protein, partial [Cyanobacteria bacterium J06641_5]
MYFSVVIPTYNRLPILEKCLRALEQQRIPSETKIAGYEVVVVDDGSTDGTLGWLGDRVAEFPHVRTCEQAHQGPAAARNLGVREAKGDTIIFI